MAEEGKKDGRKGKRNISVRGVKNDIYRAITDTSRRTGHTLGEITNDAYRVFLSTVEGAKKVTQEFIDGTADSSVVYISDIKQLEMTNEELSQFKKRVCFKNIEKLDLSNLNSNTIEEKIVNIINVNTLVLPRGFSRINILDKCRFVDRIDQK